MLSYDREQAHKFICENMHELYLKKNKDYGGSVTETYKKYGLTSFLVRMEDKLNRIYNINKNGECKVKDESVRDTLIDLANYAILAVIELDCDKYLANNEVGESDEFANNRN